MGMAVSIKAAGVALVALEITGRINCAGPDQRTIGTMTLGTDVGAGSRGNGVMDRSLTGRIMTGDTVCTSRRGCRVILQDIQTSGAMIRI